MKVCPECKVGPGEYHRPTCYGGSINYSDFYGRFWPPPPKRLAKWRGCGPSADQVAARPELRRAESSGVIIVR